jgi:hypothetical protein
MTMNDDVDGSAEAEPGYALGALLITGLALPQLAVLGGFIFPDSRDGEFLVGTYIIYIGCLFLSSYYWSHKTFVLRGFMWICEHFSSPAGRKMAFFYFALCLFLGTMALMAGLGVIEMRH